MNQPIQPTKASDRMYLSFLFMRVEVAFQAENLTPMYQSIVEECEGQSSLLQFEIKRLQDQRATLCEMIKYIEVEYVLICMMDRMLVIRCNLVSAY